MGVALDVTLAVDIPGVPDHERVTELGEGAAIKIMDSSSISHPGLVAEFKRLARKRKIKHQMEILPRGGTDAGAMQRIQAGVPVMALGKAIYNIPGLCHQGGLDEFWSADASVDTIRLNALVTALAATIQVPGGFDGEGVQPGADTMAERILAPRLPVDTAHLQ